ncbi:hypothetical protein [Iamia sp.]|uniref:hypothetical protein n=1 Tax=Iamia sp. TaxID=2722710 RepID=UPI002C8EA9BA|nr:hypothetical protein [Iamia sp.]HXH58297.1 hypothetical protein [Iamia sp.]
MSDIDEPDWLTRLRPAAKQRPRTQFVRIRWHDLQDLLRERDALWHAVSEDTRNAMIAARREYGRKWCETSRDQHFRAGHVVSEDRTNHYLHGACAGHRR